MEFIEELIRKSPAIETIESCIKDAVKMSIKDYWADVHTTENLKNRKDFDKAWGNWCFDNQIMMDSLASTYRQKRKNDLIWTLYDIYQVAECLKEDFLEPILWSKNCNGSWHKDVQKDLNIRRENRK